MATVNSEPPSYIEQPTTDNVDEGELPEYSRVAAADERIVDAQPQARHPRSSTTLPVEYVFRSKRLELNMGQKKYPVKVPCYGWNGIVQGNIIVKDLKSVAKVTVTLEGTCESCVTERGMVVYNTTKTLLFMPRIIWTRPESGTVPEGPMDFPFSFQLPTLAQGTETRLPHSYAAVHVGLSAHVTYSLRVDLFRKGLHRHERLKTMILYLPRSTPPEASFQRQDFSGEHQDIVEWENIPIYPRYTLPPTKANGAETRIVETPSEAINLMLPLPKVYASAAHIPFHLAFPADSPFLEHIFTKLSVHLIKYTVIRSGGFVSVKDGIIGVGEIWQVDDGTYPTPPPSPSLEDVPSSLPRKVYHGMLKSVREGGETSWNMPDMVEIRYSVRVRLRALNENRDGKPLPEYHLDHPIVMCTHSRIPNADDIHDPVIGLLAVPGSQGMSTNRPFPVHGIDRISTSISTGTQDS